MDKGKNDFLKLEEFTEGMLTLFSSNYERLTKFVFDLYDIEKKGKISKKDIRIVISYINLKNNEEGKNFEKEIKVNFNDRIESQNEIFDILEKIFKNENFINYDQYLHAIENISSEIFVYVKKNFKF